MATSNTLITNYAITPETHYVHECEIERYDLKMWLDQHRVTEVTRTLDTWELTFDLFVPLHVTLRNNEMMDILQEYRDVQPILDAAMR